MDAFPNLSLYIHIPFCVKRCSYCDFYSVTGAKPSLVSRVLKRILSDAARGLEQFRPSKVSTVFIGGGTPSLVPAPELASFLNTLHSRIGRVDEFTIEANPESLSLEFIHALNHGGVNRLSMGVQTYDNRLLNWLGRPAGRELVIKADELLRTHWKGRVNRDILAALPRGPHGLLRDLEMALEDEPGHISLYELTLEAAAPLAGDPNRLKELPGEEEKLHEWKFALASLRQRGYRRYEVSNFARLGHDCLHNTRYWTLKPYLGIGPGAASTIWNGQGAERRQEPADVVRWLDKPGTGRCEEILGVRDFVLEHFIMGLRTERGLSNTRFRSIFGFETVDVIPRTVEKWQGRGLLRADLDSLRVCPPGMDLVNAILRDILDEIDDYKYPDAYGWPPAG